MRGFVACIIAFALPSLVRSPARSVRCIWCLTSANLSILLLCFLPPNRFITVYSYISFIRDIRLCAAPFVKPNMIIESVYLAYERLGRDFHCIVATLFPFSSNSILIWSFFFLRKEKQERKTQAKIVKNTIQYNICRESKNEMEAQRTQTSHRKNEN